jgi:hypothetical protein
LFRRQADHPRIAPDSPTADAETMPPVEVRNSRPSSPTPNLSRCSVRMRTRSGVPRCSCSSSPPVHRSARAKPRSTRRTSSSTRDMCGMATPEGTCGSRLGAGQGGQMGLRCVPLWAIGCRCTPPSKGTARARSRDRYGMVQGHQQSDWSCRHPPAQHTARRPVLTRSPQGDADKACRKGSRLSYLRSYSRYLA